MNKKETKLFNPVRVKRGGRFRNFLIGILVFVLVFAAVAGIYISQNGIAGAKGIIKKAGSAFESEKSSEKTDPAAAEALKSANINILLMSISSEATQESGQKEIYFMVIAHADAATGQIKFCPLTVKQNYIGIFEDGGAEALTKAVAKEYGIKMTKYISSNENTFALALNYMGGLPYNVPERIEYRTPDLTLILTPGKQTLKGEVLVKYLKYFKTNNLSKQGEMFCLMVNNYFTKDNFDNAMDVYKGVLKNLSGNSNISFVETADNLKYIETVINCEGKKAVTVSSVGEF